MIRLAAAVAVIAVVATSGLANLDRLTDGTASVEVGAAPGAPAAPPPSGGARFGDLIIEADRRGHFQVDATIGGQRVPMLVDTGATVIALRAADARRLGVHPSPADYDVQVSTANGTVRAARAMLPEVTVGPVRVRQVAALVLPDKALSTNLLGMSFLGRANRFEISGSRMVLAD